MRPPIPQRRPVATGYSEGWSLWFLAGLLVINLFLLARAVDMVRFPGELTEVEITRQGGLVLVRHYEAEARNLKLDQSPAVREVLAQFKFELEQGVTTEQVAAVINSYGRRVQEVIAREQEGKLHERIRQLIIQDPNLSGVARAFLRVVPEGPDRVQIEDPDQILSEKTRQALRSDPAVRQLTQTVEIEVVEGKVNLLTPRTLPEEVEAMRKEVALLRTTLQDLRRTTGYGPMTGAGVVIKMRGPSVEKVGKKGTTEGEMIFGSEVRDLVNELLAAGAIGIEIGGERMVATTSIRNVGNLLLVNNRVVETNPLVIKAVGDPVVLRKSLDLLVNTPYFEPLLEFEVKPSLTLQPYRGSQ